MNMTNKQPENHRQLSANIDQARLSDIAPVFNLIQEYSANDYFNNLYLQPRYQAGLGIQLFSILLFGRIRLPDGSWYKTNLLVARQNNAVLGFVITRCLTNTHIGHEIYMCAVVDLYRRKGLGKRLIKAAIAHLPNDTIIDAECMPKARQMKQLLSSLGFESVGADKKTGTEKFKVRKTCIRFDN